MATTEVGIQHIQKQVDNCDSIVANIDKTVLDISQKSIACELDEKATLKQAWNALNKNKVNVLIIPYKNYANPHTKFGVLTRATIEHNVWQH